MGAHHVNIRTNGRLGTAMRVDRNQVTLNAGFVAAVKNAYTGGHMERRRPDTIIAAVDGLLRAHKGAPLVPWTNAAIDAALSYLEDKGQITLPSDQMAKVA